MVPLYPRRLSRFLCFLTFDFGDGGWVRDAPFPTTDDVYYIISQFDEKKGKGPYSIPPKIIKLISIEICKPLSWIANICFSTGVHPESLKLAKIVPIYKKGSKLLTCNYRPISLLSYVNK